MNLSEITIVPVKNIEKYIKNPNLLQIFSDREIKYCSKFKDSSIHFAGKLAAKKSSIKLLKKISKENYLLRDIEIINLPSGKPLVHFKNPKKNKNIKISLSISHTKDIAISLCIANV
ncbi:MAG: 4'-phosphopantetheinyl transferase superfamily protein [Candidatus Omnitrophica bacterium]|jgi:phosphopantetheine--protein transferase-like protein|nr:4'-phosphopantetheinyl transferase superfamily protein [Candidatus Omnitrophota bacterium]